MKRSIIKIITRAFVLVQAVMITTSCSNFLNIDNYFDDEFNIDSVFTNARYMEAYMWGAAAMFPDEAQTIRNGYTPGPMATDEGFNGLTGSGTANIYIIIYSKTLFISSILKTFSKDNLSLTKESV